MDLALLKADDITKAAEELRNLARMDPVAFWHVQAPDGPDGRSLWDHANPSQLAFHKSQARTRVFCGGNSAGKTEACCRELAYWLTGRHPFRQTPKVRMDIRYYALNYGKIREIVIPKLMRCLPKGMIDKSRGRDGYNREEKILYVRCPWDSEPHRIFMCTYDQDLGTAEGGQYHARVWDEPPPRPLYVANRVRGILHGGHEWMAFTPLANFPWDISWIYHEIVQKADGKEIEVFFVDTRENLRNLDRDAFESAVAQMSEEEKEVRLKGRFQFLKGLVYNDPQLGPAHIIERFNGRTVETPVAAKNAVLDYIKKTKTAVEIWRGLDHGIGNPTAVSWWLIDGKGEDARCYKFMDYIRAGLSVAHNCELIRELDEGLPEGPWAADPSIWQRDPATGTCLADEYHRHGLPIFASNNVFHEGTAIVQRLMRIPKDADGKTWKENPSVPPPRFLVFKCCQETIRAYQSYIWRPPSTRRGVNYGAKAKPAEKYKHIPDTDRYVLVLRPWEDVGEAPSPPAFDSLTGEPLWAKTPVDRFKAAELALAGEA